MSLQQEGVKKMKLVCRAHPEASILRLKAQIEAVKMIPVYSAHRDQGILPGHGVGISYVTPYPWAEEFALSAAKADMAVEEKKMRSTAKKDRAWRKQRIADLEVAVAFVRQAYEEKMRAHKEERPKGVLRSDYGYFANMYARFAEEDKQGRAKSLLETLKIQERKAQEFAKRDFLLWNSWRKIHTCTCEKIEKEARA
jgi:hypothetical protein